MAYTEPAYLFVYEQDTGLKYPPLAANRTKTRKIAGVTVTQRHDWTNIRYREIKSSIEGRPINYRRCGRQLALDV